MANAKISFSLLLLLGPTCALACANETADNASSQIAQFHDEFLNEDYDRDRILSPETIRAFEEFKKDDKKRAALKVAASALGGAGLGLAVLAPHLYMRRESSSEPSNPVGPQEGQYAIEKKAQKEREAYGKSSNMMSKASVRMNAWKGAVGVSALMAVGALVLGILSSRANEKMLEKRRRFRGKPKFLVPNVEVVDGGIGWYPRGNLDPLTESHVAKAMADVVEGSSDYEWPTEGWRRPALNLEKIKDAQAVADEETAQAVADEETAQAVADGETAKAVADGETAEAVADAVLAAATKEADGETAEAVADAVLAAAAKED